MRPIGRGAGPLDDQGVFISIIVRNETHHLKPHPGIKGLCSDIASSHFRPHFLKMWSIHHSPKKSGADAFSSMLWVNCNRDHMPILGEDDITQDFFSVAIGGGVDQEGIGVEHVKVQEGRPIVRRFGEGSAFDLENRI